MCPNRFFILKLKVLNPNNGIVTTSVYMFNNFDENIVVSNMSSKIQIVSFLMQTKDVY